ncbi:MAG: 50S ribosomal protein L24 [Alphaproteobacteria bacterium]|jgi:large subunit ribosomal protein L24|nr:50S ribosomal protein L24 [Alphaproteobacteria bacterium]
MKIKKGDEVIVISGKYKGVKGKVLEARPSESRVVVAGVNRRKWHIKPTQEKPGHIEDREAPIHVSNVAILDPKTKKATRVGYKIEGDKKIRIAKKSGEKLN